MIRTMAITHDKKIRFDVPFEQLDAPDVSWYWVDFNAPTDEEAALLETRFHFHHLAVEDCYYGLQRPKLDHYEDVHFFVLHAINSVTLGAEEVDLFVSDKFVVTFHYAELREMDEAWKKLAGQEKAVSRGPLYAAYVVMDKLIDHYFPGLYQIEDQLNQIENRTAPTSIQKLMDQVFAIRSDLLKLRGTIVPMRDLLYRVLNSDRIEGLKPQLVYFKDVYDHLLKLSEMIDSNREITSEMRDSYLSINSNRMNTIMKTLTVITTIFMPLTFLAGIYGMNFEYMPELTWRYGYFGVLFVMLCIGLGMYVWFKRKGWFD